MQFLSILLAVVFVLLPLFILWGFKRISEASSSSEKHEELRELENAVSHLLADLEKSTNETIGRFENAVEGLNDTIELANEKTKQLEALLAGSLPSHAVTKEPGMIGSTFKQPKELQAGDFLAEAPRELAPLNQLGNPTNKILVLDLARQGWSIQEIAKKTGTGAGEVQLILHLRNLDNN